MLDVDKTEKASPTKFDSNKKMKFSGSTLADLIPEEKLSLSKRAPI